MATAKPKERSVDIQPFEPGQCVVADSDGKNFIPGPVPMTDGSFVITGSEIITDLGSGTATEITVEHGEAAAFESCGYPQVDGPAGVRVTVLALGTNGDSTTGSQFVLLVENVSYLINHGYGGSQPDIELDWTRRGSEA